METNRIKRFATEARKYTESRSIAAKTTTLGFDKNGNEKYISHQFCAHNVGQFYRTNPIASKLRTQLNWSQNSATTAC